MEPSPEQIATELQVYLDDAERKAWDALSRYKFQMFGYWASVWVHLNRVSQAGRPNPWRGLVQAARDKGAGLDMATCRVCGCTEEESCEDGCWWVEDPEGLGDLCSSCLFELRDRFNEAARDACFRCAENAGLPGPGSCLAEDICRFWPDRPGADAGSEGGNKASAGTGAEARVSELEAAIRKAIKDLDDHDHEPVYGNRGLIRTRCVVPNGKLCTVLDDLRDALGQETEATNG